jgi:2-dehydropantoate 2-reductase
VRYIIIGAGAIGGALGARLAQHSTENPPLLIARGKHGDAVRENGLRLRSPDEDALVPIECAAGPDEVALRADDVLILATKTQDAQTALQQWVDAPVFDHEGTRKGTAGTLLPILTALNGVESERIALRLFARVLGVCVWLPAVHLAPGEVILRIAPTSGIFIIGRYGAAADVADRQLLATIAADWTASTFTIHIVDDVMRWKYNKLLSNLGNAVQALLATMNDDAAGIVDRLHPEAEEIYRATGIQWVGDDEEAQWRGDVFRIRPVAGTPERLGGSSWQSLARGRSIETDYLNGEIVLMARLRGLAAPLNETVQRLARAAASSGGGVGSMTVAELEALLP